MPETRSESLFMSHKESDLRAAFLQQVDFIPDGERIKQCIQCGTCTGSCPVSYAMDLTPRKVIALFRAGEIEQVLRSNAPWTCASCYACTVRCPAGIKITDIMYAFKRIAMKKHIYPPNIPIHTLSRTFIKIVNKYGRNSEVGLLITYGLKTNPLKLLRQLPFALRLQKKGRIRFTPAKIKQREQLSRIIQRTRAINGMKSPVAQEG